jgi:hypothetical protein
VLVRAQAIYRGELAETTWDKLPLTEYAAFVSAEIDVAAQADPLRATAHETPTRL